MFNRELLNARVGYIKFKFALLFMFVCALPVLYSVFVLPNTVLWLLLNVAFFLVVFLLLYQQAKQNLPRE